MYWYIKYPLMLVIAFIVGLGTIKVWKLIVPEPEGTSENNDKEQSSGDGEIANFAPSDLQVKIRQARGMISTNVVQAREQAEKMMAEHQPEIGSRLWNELVDILNISNTKILREGISAVPEREVYTIQRGDSLDRISRRFNTTVEAIQVYNRMPKHSHIIHPGRTLNIYRGDWRIVAYKSHCILLLYNGDRLFKQYPISPGLHDKTKVGVFSIENRSVDPPWWTSEGPPIPFGDPRNVLGTRWLGLRPIEGTDPSFTSFGIHGTTEPEKIGQPASDGCLRMYNEDVEELYMFVLDGTRVEIKE